MLVVIIRTGRSACFLKVQCKPSLLDGEQCGAILQYVWILHADDGILWRACSTSGYATDEVDTAVYASVVAAGYAHIATKAQGSL